VTTAAVIFCDPTSGSHSVAGLSVLDRLVVALHRAGCAPITIVGSPEPRSLERSRALDIATTIASEPPELDGQRLVANSNVLVTVGDVQALLAQALLARGGRLASRQGELLPIGVAVDALEAGASPNDMLRSAPAVPARSVAVLVDSSQQAREAERDLWASLESTLDGFVDKYFNRPLARPMSKVLVHTPVTPNQVSVVSLTLGFVAVAVFCRGTYLDFVVGAAIFQVSTILDCLDGDLARAVFKESRLGKWLDIIGDQVVHAALFVGIAYGVHRAGSDAPVLLLGASAAIGVALSFALVLRIRLRTTGQNGRLSRLIDATTNRDFSVAVIGFAVIGRMDLLVWAAGIGVHFFWVLVLLVQHLDSAHRKKGAGVMRRTPESQP